MFGMCNVQDVGYSGFDMFGVWDVSDARCSKCGMFRM